LSGGDDRNVHRVIKIDAPRPSRACLAGVSRPSADPTDEVLPLGWACHHDDLAAGSPLTRTERPGASGHEGA